MIFDSLSEIMHILFSFLYIESLLSKDSVTEWISLGRMCAVVLRRIMSAHMVVLGCNKFYDAERSIIGTFHIQ